MSCIEGLKRKLLSGGHQKYFTDKEKKKAKKKIIYSHRFKWDHSVKFFNLEFKTKRATL
jgi:hypothetical protein